MPPCKPPNSAVAGICNGLYLAQILHLSALAGGAHAAAERPKSMNINMRTSQRIALAMAMAVAAVVLYRPAAAAPPADHVLLAPHRAIYDLKLSKAHGSRGIEAVRGRILYDFSGNACEGYQLQFRQVSELDSGEGQAALSDLRSTTWED
ncbi:MAG: DUF1849 family protein, partial [Pseudolabrys sp.]